MQSGTVLEAIDFSEVNWEHIEQQEKCCVTMLERIMVDLCRYKCGYEQLKQRYNAIIDSLKNFKYCYQTLLAFPPSMRLDDPARSINAIDGIIQVTNDKQRIIDSILAMIKFNINNVNALLSNNSTQDIPHDLYHLYYGYPFGYQTRQFELPENLLAINYYLAQLSKGLSIQPFNTSRIERLLRNAEENIAAQIANEAPETPPPAASEDNPNAMENTDITTSSSPSRFTLFSSRTEPALTPDQAMPDFLEEWISSYQPG